ncbi:hypothetical protein U0070_018847 [Myodes glareolus]|uniref:Uncharacterized protein n=1 Tax=Myodes glareolus TaxID=447135 RepID=A0AAW0JVZ7_MYOGA
MDEGLPDLAFRVRSHISPHWPGSPSRMDVPTSYKSQGFDKNLKVTQSSWSAGMGLHLPDQKGVQFCGFGLELRLCKYHLKVNLHRIPSVPSVPKSHPLAVLLSLGPSSCFPQGSLLKAAEEPSNHSPFPLADS